MARDFIIPKEDIYVYHTYAVQIAVDNTSSLATVSNDTSSAYLATFSQLEVVNKPLGLQINGPISLKNTHVAYQLAVGDKE